MKEVKDQDKIAEWKDELKLDEKLGLSDIELRAYRYEKHELITSPGSRTERMLFIAEGEAVIYSIRRDGSAFPISTIRKGELIGDL